MSDWNLKRLTRRLKHSAHDEVECQSRDFPFEKARLQITFPLAFSTATFVAIYSWALNYEVHPAFPLVVLFFIGHGMAGVSSTLSTLVIDCHTDRPATATAAVNLVKCLLGAGANAAAVPLINRISVGWTGSLFALICILSSPLIFVVYVLGHGWRREGQIAL
jgi:sugar phosphate permease